MTTIFSERGEAIPVTVIEAGPNHVLNVRTQDRDGYEAVQLGFSNIESRKLTKPVLCQMKQAGVSVRYVREMSADDVSEHTPG